MRGPAIVVIALLAAAAYAGFAQAQSRDGAFITIEFDNRGSKVMSKDTNAKIIRALAEKVFLVSPGQVALAGGLGQSNLINHKSTVIYTAQGPASNGKSVYANCQAAVKKGWVRGSVLEKSLKKATDSWLPGDSVTVKKAVCTSLVSGRKLAM